MSLQGLISGSECAIDSNPLSQVMKHANGDRSLQQDRIAGPSFSRLHHLPGTASESLIERDVQLARQFFDGPVHGPGPVFTAPQHLPPLTHFYAAEMNNANRLDLAQNWASVPRSEQMHHLSTQTDTSWASEFQPTSSVSMPASSAKQNMTQSKFPLQSQLMSPMMYGLGTTSPMSMGMYMPNTSMYDANLQMMGSQTMGKGKGKLREEDFENAFAQAAASIRQTESARIEEITEERFTGLEDAMQNSSLSDTQGEMGNVNSMQLPTKVRPQDTSNFDQVWDQLQKSDVPPPKEDMEKWESEFNQLMNSQREDSYDIAPEFKNMWGEYGDFDQPSNSASFDDEGIPNLGPYIFEEQNQYLVASVPSLLAEAKALLNENGSLSEAALLLEAAIQKGELGEGGYEAWLLLGETRNMDEREDAGIKALKEGVRLAQVASTDGAGMMALAISYTNERYDRAAHSILLRWLSLTHPSADIPQGTWESLKEASWHSHEQIIQVFLNLARSQHSQGIIDPDVQNGLGILFYTNSEYDRAKDCFEVALSARPTDYQLWNRLGSCLSNGEKHEESLGAYREALNLRPTYVRAIANVAVACLNIGAFQEAAEHLLSALSMQRATAGQTSDQLWFTLRRVFLEMNRTDLSELTKDENRNVEAFRKEGFEF